MRTHRTTACWCGARSTLSSRPISCRNPQSAPLEPHSGPAAGSCSLAITRTTGSRPVGRFSFSSDRMRGLLGACGFVLEFLGIDRLVVTYRDLTELAQAEPRVHEKFRGDARWTMLATRFRDGPAQLTWSTLVGV